MLPPQESTSSDSDNQALKWPILVHKAVMPFSFDIPLARSFEGQFDVSSFLDAHLFSLATGVHSAERTAEHLADQDDRSFVVTFQLEGTLHLTQSGRRAKVGPGQFATYASDLPVKIEGSNHYRSLSLKIPASRFSSSSEKLHQLSATTFDAEHGLAAAVQVFLKNLQEGGGAITQTTKAAISHHVVGMVEQVLRDEYEQSLSTKSIATNANDLRDQCTTFIESNLHNPELNPQMIANAAFISTRYLHQLFSHTDTTVANYVRSRRLERIREDLSSPSFATQPIEQIILRWGVQNVSYFGQVFKKIEGCTPAEFRRRALGI